MDRTEILNKIKKIEAENAEKKNDCETDCRKTISDSEEEVREIRKNSEVKRRKNRTKALDDFATEIEKKKSSILAKGESDAKALTESAGKKMEEVVSFIVSEFERTFNV